MKLSNSSLGHWECIDKQRSTYNLNYYPRLKEFLLGSGVIKM